MTTPSNYKNFIEYIHEKRHYPHDGPVPGVEHDFIDFSNNKASRHVTVRDAFKRRFFTLAAATLPTPHRQGLHQRGLHQQNNFGNTAAATQYRPQG
jgi:hypothetical protein